MNGYDDTWVLDHMHMVPKLKERGEEYKTYGDFVKLAELLFPDEMRNEANRPKLIKQLVKEVQIHDKMERESWNVRTRYDFEANGEELHVVYEEYGDGSGPRFRLRRQLDKGFVASLSEDERKCTCGTNERLSASEIEISSPVLLKDTSTNLTYSRSMRYVYKPFLMIDGDLGRSHYPQPWAKGILPIISVKRAVFFARNPSRVLLQYRVPETYIDQFELAQWYYFLLFHGWRNGFTPPARTPDQYLILLRGQGFDKISVHDVESFDGPMSDISEIDSARDMIYLLRAISEAFEKHAIVPSAPLPKMNHNVKIQGEEFAEGLY